MGQITLLSRLLDFVVPRYCCVCGRRLSVGEDLLCLRCNAELPLTNYDSDFYSNEMAKTFWWRVKPFERAYALLHHKSHSQSARLIYDLKYHGRQQLGIDLGQLMAHRLKPVGFFSGIDAIVPVPLTPGRKRERGYNQSELIAQGVAWETRLPVWRDVVRRTSFGGTQTHKDRLGRLEGVEHAFELTGARDVAGRHLLIVDDVVTTGATVCAVAAQLQRCKDVSISVLAIAFAGDTKKL